MLYPGVYLFLVILVWYVSAQHLLHVMFDLNLVVTYEHTKYVRLYLRNHKAYLIKLAFAGKAGEGT